MRQAGTIKDQREANRFAAWLVTQRIEAHAEQEGDAWAIWVRDEDQISQAREAMAHFQAHPQDERYRGAERTAEQILRDEQQQRRQARDNVVAMRDRWGSGGTVARRCPLVLALIGASILVTILVPDQQPPPPGGSPAAAKGGDALYDNLLFTDPRIARIAGGGFDVWASIRRGQVWRLITPIFIHYGMPHLVFNMIWLFMLGGQIENRRGTGFMAILVLILAIASNVAQAVELSIVAPGADFGGMSGVGYGIFGFLLIKVKFDNRDHYQLSQMTIMIGVAWFVLCIARSFPEMESVLSFIPPIANTAHTVGLFLGMALAYGPLLVRRAPR